MSEYSIGRLTRKRDDGTAYRHYVMRYHDDAGSHRISLGTDDRPTAEALARDLWSKRTLANVESVGAIVTAWLAATETDRGHTRAAAAWKAAQPFWVNVRPGLIDAAMCRSYAAQRGRAANTIRNELSCIRMALKWAKVKTPEPIWTPPMPESETEHLTVKEFRKFLAGCSAPHVRLFAQLAVMTAARSTALRQLRWSRVDLERGIIDLNPKGEGRISNKGRAVLPINDDLMPLLIEAKEAAQTEYVIEYQGGPVASIKKGFLAASARSGVHCTPHMLRHSAAVRMAEARTPMEEIARFLGHKNTNVTISTYARFHPEYLRRAAKTLKW